MDAEKLTLKCFNGAPSDQDGGTGLENIIDQAQKSNFSTRTRSYSILFGIDLLYPEILALRLAVNGHVTFISP